MYPFDPNQSGPFGPPKPPPALQPIRPPALPGQSSPGGMAPPAIPTLSPPAITPPLMPQAGNPSPLAQGIQQNMFAGLGYGIGADLLGQIPALPLPQGTGPGGPKVQASPKVDPSNPTGGTASGLSGNSADWKQVAASMASTYGVPVEFYDALINQESGWNPDAIGGDGERGLTQVMPGNLSAWGVDPNDPISQLQMSAQKLKQYYDQTGSWIGAAISWNAGPGAYQTYLQTGRLPASTIQYVKNVTGLDPSSILG